MVYGRKPAVIILHVIWCRYYFIHHPAGKKIRWPLANRLFYSPTIMATSVWLIQCFCAFMVLGYFISLCNCRHHHVCIPSALAKNIDHWSCYIISADDDKRKCRCNPSKGYDRSRRSNRQNRYNNNKVDGRAERKIRCNDGNERKIILGSQKEVDGKKSCNCKR